MPNKNILVKVNFTKRDDIPYKVEHYKEKLDGTYELADTESLVGTYEDIVTATNKEYKGYTFDTDNPNIIKSGTIDVDGTLVLK